MAYLHLDYFLQNYKIDLSFSIKLQEINLNVCEEYKTECKARDPNRTERKARRLNCLPQARSNLRAKRAARNENVPAKRADFSTPLLFAALQLKCELYIKY